MSNCLVCLPWPSLPISPHLRRSFIVAGERNAFDWIQVALLDSAPDTAGTASRRRDAQLDLRLLRSECNRAAVLLEEEQGSLLETLQVMKRV